MTSRFVQSIQQAKRTSAMSSRICPAISLNSQHPNQQIESACHVLDAREDHRCLTDEDCGVDGMSCRRRTCSIAGYCGLWLLR